MKRMKRSCQICECCHAAVVPPCNCQRNCCCCWTRPAAVSRLQATVQHQDECFRTSCFNVLTPIFMLLHSLHMHVLTSYIPFFLLLLVWKSVFVGNAVHSFGFLCAYETDRCVGPQAHLANGLFVLGGNRGDLQMRWMLWHRTGPVKLGHNTRVGGNMCLCVGGCAGLNMGPLPPNKLKTALVLTQVIPLPCRCLAPHHI